MLCKTSQSSNALNGRRPHFPRAGDGPFDHNTARGSLSGALKMPQAQYENGQESYHFLTGGGSAVLPFAASVAPMRRSFVQFGSQHVGNGVQHPPNTEQKSQTCYFLMMPSATSIASFLNTEASVTLGTKNSVMRHGNILNQLNPYYIDVFVCVYIYICMFTCATPKSLPVSGFCCMLLQ